MTLESNTKTTSTGLTKIFNIVMVLLSVAYPFLVYAGLQHFDPRTLILLLIAILGLRFLTLKNTPANHWLWIPLLGVLCVWVAISNSDLGLKFYPVFINASFFILFLGSLIRPPVMIERFARLRPAMIAEIRVSEDSDEIIPLVKHYMKNVTIVWCLFFVVNGGIAFALAVWGSDRWWALYNGLISYGLIALLFFLEWLARQRVIKKVNG